jgi:4-amino-4-deoxy-L-arabinose transferase-like glycosyltransferase
VADVWIQLSSFEFDKVKTSPNWAIKTSTADSPSLRVAVSIAIQDRALLLVLAVYVVLAMAWNFVTPIFEAPDEPDHLQYVLFVADEGRLPDLQVDVLRAGIESPQPPFYYFLMGILVRISGVPRPFVHPVLNPDFDFVRMDSPPNYFLPVADSFGYVHFLRVASTLFGLITVICTYLMATLLSADRTLRVAATTLTAFLPQFTFISAVISNDMLTAAVTSASIVWLLYLCRLKTVRAWQLFLFGGMCGLAFLSKSHVIFLLPFGIIMFLLAYADGYKHSLKGAAWSVAGFILVGGWWLVYNQLHYGDPTAVNMQTMIVPNLVDRKTLFDSSDRLYFAVFLPRLLYKSFLGTFGWMKIFLPDVFYLIFAMMWLGSIIGMAYGLLKRKWERIREGLILAPLMALAVIVYVNFTFTAPQGRYFFPELGLVSLIFVFGVAELPPILGRWLIIAMPIFLLLVNLYSLWLVSVAFG